MSDEVGYVLSVVLVFFVWCAYSYIEGVREAYYYHSAIVSGDSSKYNVHMLYTQQRVIVIALIFVVLGVSFTSVVACVSFTHIFPLIHDGAYYCKRNDLNTMIYNKRWKADSSTSTAKFEIKYRGRLIMFICGMSLIITTVILTLLKII